MTAEEFLKKYSNVPLDKRLTIINFAESGLMTLEEFYTEIHKTEEYIRTLRNHQQSMINMVKKYL